MPLTYGGVNLELLRTTRVARTSVYDEQGSYLRTEWEIDGNFVINPTATSYRSDPPVATPGMFPDVTDQALRHYMLQPRMPLVWTIDVQPAMESPPFIDGVQAPCDAINGPHPQHCTITRIDGSKTLMVRYGIKTGLIECLPGTGPGAIISNVWSCQDDIDEQHRTTRSYRGVARFRADMLRLLGQSGDFYRDQVLPPVLSGFKPTHANFSLSEDGLTLGWNIQHVEQFYSLGDTDPRRGGLGATRIEARYLCSSAEGPDGVAGFQMVGVEVQVWGSKYSTHWGLTQAAMKIAQAKLPLGDPAKGFIRRASVTQDLTGRSITLQIMMQLVIPSVADIAVLDSDQLRTFLPGDPNGINPGLPNDSGSRGTETREMVVAGLREACRGLLPPSTSRDHPGDSSLQGQGGPEAVPIEVVPVVPPHPVAVSVEGSAFPFTQYQISIINKTNDGILHAPVAGGQPALSEFLKVHSPITTMTVEWEAERAGKKPWFPSPFPTDPNYVLLERTVKGAAPVLTADGSTRAWKAQGRYVYGLRYSNGPGENFQPLGILPWMSIDRAESFIDPEQYVSGILTFTGQAPVPNQPNR